MQRRFMMTIHATRQNGYITKYYWHRLVTLRHLRDVRKHYIKLAKRLIARDDVTEVRITIGGQFYTKFDEYGCWRRNHPVHNEGYPRFLKENKNE